MKEAKDIKVVIVDDSPFSVAMITNILTAKGFDVVGSGNNLQEAEEVVGCGETGCRHDGHDDAGSGWAGMHGCASHKIDPHLEESHHCQFHDG